MSLFDNVAYSDITIKFGDREVKAHKSVLCTKLEYFEKLFGETSKFKVRTRVRGGFASSLSNDSALADDDLNRRLSSIRSSSKMMIQTPSMR